MDTTKLQYNLPSIKTNYQNRKFEYFIGLNEGIISFMNIKFFNHKVDPEMLDILACSLNAFDNRLKSISIYAYEKVTPINDKPIQEIHLRATLVNGVAITVMEFRDDQQADTSNVVQHLSQLLASRYGYHISRLGITSMDNVPTINHLEKSP